jgi:hypothetical protein
MSLAHAYNPSYWNRLGELQFKASTGRKSTKPPSQPVKVGHGGVYLSFQLCNKNNKRIVVHAGSVIKSKTVFEK